MNSMGVGDFSVISSSDDGSEDYRLPAQSKHLPMMQQKQMSLTTTNILV